KALIAGLIGAAMAVSAPAAFAQARSQAADSAWYAGGSLGQANAKCNVSGGSCDKTDTAWKIFGGYQINRTFGVELGYADLGKVKLSGGASSLSIETKSWDLVGVGSFPVANQFSIYGKLGFSRSESKVASAKDNSTNLTFGLGAQYDF